MIKLNSLKEAIFPKTKTDIWDRLMTGILLAIVFLLPIFFLPGNYFSIELNKTLLFNMLVMLAAAVFVLKLLITREIKIKLTYLDWLMGIFVLFYALSFIFSRNHYLSLFGANGYFNSSLPSIICFVLFFYLIQQVIKSKKEIAWFAWAFCVSSALVMVFNLGQLNGIHFLPWPAAQESSFYLATNSSLALGIFTGVGLLMGVGLLLMSRQLWTRIICGLFALLSLASLFYLGKEIALYLVAFALFLFLIIASLRSKNLSSWWLVLPTILLMVVMLFVFIDTSSITQVQVRDSVLLYQKTSAQISWQNLSHTPLWGSGPGTYAYDFDLYRPVEFNNTGQWNYRFIKAANEWLTEVSTIGLVSLAALLAIGFLFFIRNLSDLIRLKNASGTWPWQSMATGAWFMILMAAFFMPFNFLLAWLWWLLLAFGYKISRLEKDQDKILMIKSAPVRTLATTLSFAVILIGLAAYAYFGGRVWLADHNYAKAQSGINNKEEITKVLEFLENAAQLNPYDSSYYIALAQGYATQVQLMSSQKPDDTAALQPLAQKVIDTLNKAIGAEPQNAAVYVQTANVYDALRNLVSNVDELSAKAYDQAVELEPYNALTRLNLGRSQLFWAQGLAAAAKDEAASKVATDILNQAISNFQTAGVLKANFSAAEYSLGLAYIEAGQLDQAAAEFDRVISELPNAVEAHWQLALVYQQQNKFQEALSEVQIALQLEPDNTQIKDKIAELQAKISESTKK